MTGFDVAPKCKSDEWAARQVRTGWWAASMDRWLNQTGIAHAIHGGGALCGARPYDMGGSFASAAETGAQECKRCRKIINNAQGVTRGS